MKVENSYMLTGIVRESFMKMVKHVIGLEELIGWTEGKRFQAEKWH